MSSNITLESLIDEGYSLSEQYSRTDNFLGTRYIENGPFTEWSRKALMYLQNNFPTHPQTGNFEQLVLSGRDSLSDFNSLIGILKAFDAIKPQVPAKVDHKELLCRIFDKFHIIARQIKRRHSNRPTIQINDEYDVQDLLNAVLCLFFDDVRPEEWTPSYAGGCNRIDFLINDEKIAIEVKMTRDGLKDKELGEQLLVDIAKYKSHPNCKALYSFIYDPEGYIRNPRGLEKDLDKTSTNEFEVKTYIRPL